MSEREFSLAAALEQLHRIQTMPGSGSWRLVVRKTNPGALAAHQTTEVQGIFAGIDWEAGKVIIEPATPLTELSPEQVEAIWKSVRAGSSWHAYQREQKLRDRIAELEAELAAMRVGRPAPSSSASDESGLSC